MAEFVKTKTEIEHFYNANECRHYLNGVQIAFHCHHYTALYTQLALDANETELLAQVSEESFYQLLTSYFNQHNVKSPEKQITIACDYYSALGLGTLKAEYIGYNSARIVSESSHVEQGWIKKWGTYDKPVNYIGCGYVAALLAVINNTQPGAYKTTETESIVMGNNKTVFTSYKK